jgi:hypothetical protein
MAPKASQRRSGWVLQLQGNPLDLKFWADCFPNRPLKVFEREGVFYCEADAFDSLPDVKAVCESGPALLQIDSGALRLWRSNIAAPQILGVMEKYADGSWGRPRTFLTLSLRGWLSSVYQVNGYDESPAELFVDLAERDERVYEALQDFARPSLDMPCLRRIAETIWTEFDKRDQGNAIEKMVEASLVEAKSMRRFLQTVNRGARAAHSPFRYQEYSNAMSLEGAQMFLAQLLEQCEVSGSVRDAG